MLQTAARMSELTTKMQAADVMVVGRNGSQAWMPSAVGAPGTPSRGAG